MLLAPILALTLGLACGAELELDVTVDPGPARTASTPLLVHLRPGRGLPDGWSAAAGDFCARFGVADAPPVALDPVLGADARVVGFDVAWQEGPLEAFTPRRRVLVIERGVTPEGAAFRLEGDADARALTFDGAPLLGHARAFDPARFEETYKVYDQLYGFDGALLTKPHGGLYPHHRGVFLGWAKTTHGADVHNFWHNPGAERASQRGRLVAQFAGATHARTVTHTRWIATDGTLIAEDERTLIARRPRAGERVFDYHVRIHARVGDLVLDGDPPHAGFQIRVAQEVAERQDCAYLLPAGAQDLGGDNWRDAAWVAARFAIDGRPMTVVQMDHPDNPGATVWNTRSYGRFGAFARHELAHDAPLELRYRILVQDAPPERAALDAAWRSWVRPPVVRVSAR